MPSTLALPEQRSPEFAPFRGEDSDERRENERTLDSLEAHPPHNTERSELEQSRSDRGVDMMATDEGTEEVARSPEPVRLDGFWHRVGDQWVSPSGVFRLDVRTSTADEHPWRNGRPEPLTGSTGTTQEAFRPVLRQRVFFPPPRPRPPTPPRTPTPPPTSVPSLEVTRELRPFGTDWRTFFNWSEENVGNGEDEDGFEDSDDESTSGLDAATIFVMTGADDEWDEDDNFDNIDGYLADEDEADYFTVPDEEEADCNSEDEESSIRCWSPSVLSTITMSPPGSLAHTPRTSPSNTIIWTTPGRDIAPYVAVVADTLNPPTYLDHIRDNIESINDNSQVQSVPLEVQSTREPPPTRKQILLA